MKYILVCLVFLCVFTAAPAFPGEVIIWHDAEENAHTADTLDEIPEAFRPAPQAGPASGVQTTLTVDQVRAAIAEGQAAEADPAQFMGGLGLYRRFFYNLDDKDGEAYLFIGTKYGLIKARTALSIEKGSAVSQEYIDKALATDRFYIAFYARGFAPALILLRQEDTVIKGEDGFGELDPGLSSSRMTKSFPYDAVDWTRPAEVEVYNMDGKSIVFELDWGSYK